ncbi:MAG: hypothetical protein ACLQIB_55765 [Isosphaeraceae bacterium]
MSAEMAFSTSILVVYVPLLNEGISVVRPTHGVKLWDNVYRVLPTRDYDPDDEEWEFPPGSVVECFHETRDGQEILVARKRAGET